MINIQNINGNECFKWSLVRYLNSENQNIAKIRKVDKMFESQLGFRYIKFPVKIKDICKIEKKNCICVSASGHKKQGQKFNLCVTKYFQKTYLFIIDKRRRQKVQCSYQRY